MVWVHMVAREADRQHILPSSKFSDECNCALILIPRVMDEVSKFQDAWRTVELAVGSK